jgi:hypothetical protein
VKPEQIAQLVAACRVPTSLEEQRKGPWEIRRFGWPDESASGNPFSTAMLKMKFREAGLEPFTGYTALLRDTLATMNRDYGDVVMEDTPREIRKHLPILMNAFGNVLISGLGLGCVVRGLLTRPEVKRIDIVEIDDAVISMVWPEFAVDHRCNLFYEDAEKITIAKRAHWDFAWHDVWHEYDALATIHMRLLQRFDPYVDRQGAWEFPRPAKRIYKSKRPNMLGGAR